jgi:demethylmacrocin O-methyltransferase
VNEQTRSVLRRAALLPRDPRLLRFETPLLRWNLDALAMLYKTDKAPHLHGYTRHYRRHLRGRRHKIRKVLEIGIGGFEGPRSGGASLRMWRDWLPYATVYGLDVDEKQIDEPRIVTLLGDQGDPDTLDDVGGRFGPFDLIVDDGSHRNADVRCSFARLWGHLRRGGYYVIEDIVTAYYAGMGGGPPGTIDTSMALVKDLVDTTQRGVLPENVPVELPPYETASVHVYPNIVFVEKASRIRQGFVVAPYLDLSASSDERPAGESPSSFPASDVVLR